MLTSTFSLALPVHSRWTRLRPIIVGCSRMDAVSYSTVCLVQTLRLCLPQGPVSCVVQIVDTGRKQESNPSCAVVFRPARPLECIYTLLSVLRMHFFRYEIWLYESWILARKLQIGTYRSSSCYEGLTSPFVAKVIYCLEIGHLLSI